MVAEADRAYPNETGGVLVGYWARLGREVIITHAVGPGPNAVHVPKRFVPDAEYQEREIARLYSWSGRRQTYLGDWHTHPNTVMGKLSRQDRRTLRQIVCDPAARAPFALMCILAGRPDAWNYHVWSGHIARLAHISIGLKVEPSKVWIYS